MAVKSILTSQTDFTGEFPYIKGMSGLWRFNESAPDDDDMLLDSSGNDRKMLIVNWSGTTASLKSSQKGRQFCIIPRPFNAKYSHVFSPVSVEIRFAGYSS